MRNTYRVPSLCHGLSANIHFSDGGKRPTPKDTILCGPDKQGDWQGWYLQFFPRHTNKGPHVLRLTPGAVPACLLGLSEILLSIITRNAILVLYLFSFRYGAKSQDEGGARGARHGYTVLYYLHIIPVAVDAAILLHHLVICTRGLNEPLKKMILSAVRYAHFSSSRPY